MKRRIEWRRRGKDVIATIRLLHWQTHGREWIAKITGFDEKYIYQREFCPVVEKDWSRSGKNGDTCFWIKEKGYYEIREPKTGGAYRGFYYWDGNSDEITEVDEETIVEYLKTLENEKQAQKENFYKELDETMEKIVNNKANFIPEEEVWKKFKV